MNADLERLIALQKLDSTADAARKQLASEPEHERVLEARLEAARQEVAAAKDRVAVNKSARAALEKDVAMQQGRLSKFREQGMAVKTNQEFHAIQHEIAFAQTEIKKLEDTMLERMIEADDLTAALKSAETQLAAETKAIDAERKSGSAAHIEMQATLERIATERAALVSTTAPSKIVPLPRTAEPSTRNSPEDLTNPIEGDAAETTSREPAAKRHSMYLNI